MKTPAFTTATLLALLLACPSWAAAEKPTEAAPDEAADEGFESVVVGRRASEDRFRADRSRTRATGGVGLGLTLRQRIVEAHGGTIEARAREGGGAVFRVVISSAA